MRIETVMTTTVTLADGDQRTLTDRNFHDAGDNPRFEYTQIGKAIAATADHHLMGWKAMVTQ